MKVEMDYDTGELVIRIAANTVNPPLSGSGKSYIVASTQGNVKISDILVKGQMLSLGLNAYVSAIKGAQED